MNNNIHTVKVVLALTLPPPSLQMPSFAPTCMASPMKCLTHCIMLSPLVSCWAPSQPQHGGHLAVQPTKPVAHLPHLWALGRKAKEHHNQQVQITQQSKTQQNPKHTIIGALSP